MFEVGLVLLVFLVVCWVYFHSDDDDNDPDERVYV